jgi:fructose-1,6-bisphosphatase/inositol monophosphatase family enzyme
MPPDLFKRFALELAEASGAFIRPFFANPDLAVELKSDLSPVTAADRGAEELMRARIAQQFPDHGVIGEEYGGRAR